MAILEQLQSPLLAGSVPEAAEDTFQIEYPINESENNETDNNDTLDNSRSSEEEKKENHHTKEDLFRSNYMLNLGASSWFDKG